MGMIPARYTNQLVMHFLDAYQVHPDWPVAKLLTFARAKYASVALLSEVLLELERAETLPVEGDMGVHLMTFLEWHAFGSPFARLHQGDARPVFVKRPLVEAEASLQAQAQNVVEATFDLASSDGQPILFLQADWLNSVSSSLVLRIQQNGQTIHELRGDARITYRELFNYQRIEDICVGGYVDGDLYHAYWLLPLRREVGQNCLRTELVSPDAEVSVLPESAIEIWPEWETISPPAEK
jgi:hypothetical protein